MGRPRDRYDRARRRAHEVDLLRLTYEIVLVLVCGVGTVVLHLESFYEPPGNRLTYRIAVAVLVFAATAVLIPLRLARPLGALVLGGLLLIPTGGAGLTIVPLSASAGYRAWQARRIVTAYLVVLAGYLAGCAVLRDESPLGTVFLALMDFSVFALLPGAVAALVAQRRLLVMTMQQRNRELHAERRRAVEQAQTRERNRIAAELHDSLGHRLTLISLYAGGLARLPDPATGSGDPTAPSPRTSSSTKQNTQQALGLLRDTSAQAMVELRQILRILHQDSTAGDSGRSLTEIGETVDAARGTGTTVELVRIGRPRPLSLLAEHAGYRVVQEGLTNALKHAGGADIRVEIRYDDEALFVEVRNDPGRPYEGRSTGQGLAGLAERVRLAGGVLSSGSLPDGGFRIGAVLPYAAGIPGPAPDDEGGFPEEIARSTRRQRIGSVAVIASVTLGLGSCVGWMTAPTVDDTVSQATFDVFVVGGTEDGVRQKLPAESWYTDDLGDGKVCEHYLTDDTVEPTTAGADEVQFEFCFQDGRLVSKDAYDVTE